MVIRKTSKNTSFCTIKFSTLAYGVVYNLTIQIKVTLFNEHIINEHTQIIGFKDDVFTARLQYHW